MSVISSIVKNELRSYFSSPIAYVFIIIFIVVANWLFFKNFFIEQQASMRSFFNLAPWLFIFLMPALSMRIWSEDNKNGIMNFFFSLPIKKTELVIGKFIASSIICLMCIFGTLPILIIIMYLGLPDLGKIISGYIGVILLSHTYLAIGFFTSSLTKNQIISFINSCAICFFLYIIANDMITYSLPNFLEPLTRHISTNVHYTNFIRGIVSLEGIFYFTSVTFYFLFLNIQVFNIRNQEQ